MIRLRPEYEKIIQAINFFARQSKNSLTKLYILKLVFFADRYHMRMYGRMITNDCYFAMAYGPVASTTKNIFEFLSIPKHLEGYAASYLKPSREDDIHIRSIKDVDWDVFSQTDIEALKAAWEIKKNNRDLVSYSHEFPEWKRHQERLKSFPSCPMPLEDFFLQSPKSAEYCSADDNRVNCNKEYFLETSPLFADIKHG